MHYMQKWRDGLISDSEALYFLLDDLGDIAARLRANEDKAIQEDDTDTK